MRRSCPWRIALTTCAAISLTVPCLIASAANWPTPNFRNSLVFDGRDQPVTLRFAHDGSVFVAEKPGRIWMYSSLVDDTPQQVLDLGDHVHSYQDRGLLGMALDPRFPERPYVYVLYSFNGGLFADLPPRWPATGCANPIGDFAGCVISGRLSRFRFDGSQLLDEQVLIEDWYQQFPSHSIGTVRFGNDGKLYVGGGDGAAYVHADWGQVGNPAWPDQRSPTNQGGALRAQGLEVENLYSGQVWLNGSIARIDPDTGAGVPGNPLFAQAGASANAQRILAYGLRNPFRFTHRPGTSELWLADVGWRDWEEIDRLPDPATAAGLRNFGWPCFENLGHVDDYAAQPLCQSLYANGDSGGRTPVSAPFYAMSHATATAVSAIAFYTGTRWPSEYRNALFFGDYARNRIWMIADTDADGIPDPVADNAAPTFGQGHLAVVDLVAGPGGDLFYVDIFEGRIERISWDADINARNLAPSAAIALMPGSSADGPPRSISFSAANSVDPESQALTHAWDLDGDGDFDDGNDPAATASYTASGAAVETIRVGVRSTDSGGASDEAFMTISVARDLLFADGFEVPVTKGPFTTG